MAPGDTYYVTSRRSARARRASTGVPVKRLKRPSIGIPAGIYGEDTHGRTVDAKLRPGSPASALRRGGGRRALTPRSRGKGKGRRTAPPQPPPSPARALLTQARRAAARDADVRGRRPFIMDVILNARAPVSEYSEDVLMDALERSQAALPRARRHYAFDGVESVDAYWADQAALWRGVAADQRDGSPLQRYQVSAERSTAGWEIDGDEDAASSTSGPSDCGLVHVASLPSSPSYSAGSIDGGWFYSGPTRLLLEQPVEMGDSDA